MPAMSDSAKLSEDTQFPRDAAILEGQHRNRVNEASAFRVRI
jgi:hypothetical protein